MNHELNKEETIRRFLLGELSAAEQEEIEIRLLADAELQTSVEIAEFDLIDDYVRGDLTEGEVGDFRRHFLNSSERRSRLETARAWVKSPEVSAMENGSNSAPGKVVDVGQRAAAARRNPHFGWRRAVPVAAGIILVIGIGVAVRRLFFQAPVDQAVAALKKAYRQERPIESRLSGFDHAQWVQRRGVEQSSADRTLRDQAARILLGEVNDHPNAESRRALGALYLLEQKTDEAIEQLEEALKANSNNARIHNDLGAALMEMAKLQKEKTARKEQTAEQKAPEPGPGESLAAFARANEHFAQALRLDARLSEALFNQALCLQYLGLINQATEAWQRYLQVDATSKWADEARRKLKELQERKNKTTRNNDQLWRDFLAAYEANDEARVWEAFGMSRERMGNAITERLLDEYLQLSSQGRSDDANRRLAMLARAGELEASRAGDLYTRDLAKFYQRADAGQRRALTKARELFKTGREKNRTSWSEPGDYYRRAREAFAQAGSEPEARLMDYFIGVIHLRLTEHERGRRVAESLVGHAGQSRYLWLYAHALDALADLHININDYFKAISYSKRALTISEQLQDWDEMLCILSQLAREYWYLGDYEQSLNWLPYTLDVASRHPLDLQWKWMAYGATVDTFSELNLLFTSVACEKEALRLATEMDSPIHQSRSYGSLGQIYERLGDQAEASKSLEQALAIGEELRDPALRQNIKAYTLIRIGDLCQKTGRLDEALERYSEGLRIIEQRQITQESYDAHLGRLKTYLAKRNREAAQTELQTALKLFEDNRAKIGEESLRNSFFEVGEDIYDLAIQFFAEQQRDAEQAFDYSERSRARSLLDLMRTRAEGEQQKRRPEYDDQQSLSATSHLHLPEVMRRMPAEALIVQYAALDQSLRIWAVSATDFDSGASAIRLNDLNARVGAFLKCLAGQPECDAKETERQAKELYEILIRPIEAKLDAGREIIIVPDKILNHLPFAALVEPATGKYLVEKYTIAYAPSSTVFLAQTESAKRRERASAERCLIVGAPSFDRGRFPSLPPLPSTESEAVSVSRFYSHARVLLAREASESALRREAPRAEVIHIASHGIANQRMPGLSGIILADEPDRADSSADGMLQAQEVIRMKLPRASLVVLSACQTWLGRNYRGEGMVGLARAFIAAGAPMVIASLWPVKTEETEELMRSFHQSRTQEGLSTAQALRSAQLKMLRHTDSLYRMPSAWAGFIAVGGFTRF